MVNMVVVLWATCLLFSQVLTHKQQDYLTRAYRNKELPATPVSPTNKDDSKPWETSLRLPRHITPSHYSVLLHPYFETELFSGKVDIDISVTRTSQHVLLHTKDHNITETKIKTKDGKELNIINAFEFPKYEFWVIQPEEPLQWGLYTVSLTFTGSLGNGNSLDGFYKSVYTNKKGERVSIATSDFEPSDARKAYPCFDEPSFKAPFSVTLVRPTIGYIALSNMPVKEEVPNTPAAGLTTVKFEKSVPMSTYLSCFIVCDFDFGEQFTSDEKTRVRVYAAKDQKHRVQYALGAGANMTEYFETYFGIPFPLAKQDMIAIPDFQAGAMENWGLITYRETSLLYDELESSSSNLERVSTVVSHELAHQWFGNLVTMDWWNDLWLNEGFASYMEYKGVQNYHPDWDIETQFLNMDLHGVMVLDSTENSHPIIQEASSPDQVSELFDRISYGKGACVLRMLENLLGPEEFRLGVHIYLDRNRYNNAVTDDLWAALEEASLDKVPVKKIMDTWTRQIGYPVLMVEDIAQGKVRITQKIFMDMTSEENKEKFGSLKWHVPVTWITSESSKVMAKMFDQADDEMIIAMPKSANWMKLNVGQYGYYRVNYPEKTWRYFSSLLHADYTVFSPADRASLLSDAFAMAEMGLISYNIPMDMATYIRSEPHIVPMKTALGKISGIGGYLENTKSIGAFRQFFKKFLNEIYTRFGWDDQGSHMEKKTRGYILSLACSNGNVQCREKAGGMFQNWIGNGSVYIPPNLRSTVYKYGMAEVGSEESWDILFQRFLEEKKADEKAKLLSGLASIRDENILRRFLKIATDGKTIRLQDLSSTFSRINSNPLGAPIVWDFIRNEWNVLQNLYFGKQNSLNSVIKSVVSSFSTQKGLIEVLKFFQEHPEEGGQSRTRDQTIESIQSNMRWKYQHLAEIQSFLE